MHHLCCFLRVVLLLFCGLHYLVGQIKPLLITFRDIWMQRNRITYPLPPPRHRCAWVRTPPGPAPPHPPSCSSKRGRKTVHTSPPETTWRHSSSARSDTVNLDLGSVWCCWWRSSPPVTDSLTDTLWDCLAALRSAPLWLNYPQVWECGSSLRRAKCAVDS